VVHQFHLWEGEEESESLTALPKPEENEGWENSFIREIKLSIALWFLALSIFIILLFKTVITLLEWNAAPVDL
jgi:hypothetical protein